MAMGDEGKGRMEIVPYQEPRALFGARELGMAVVLVGIVACVCMVDAGAALRALASVPIGFVVTAVSFRFRLEPELRAGSVSAMPYALALAVCSTFPSGLPGRAAELLPFAALAAWCLVAACLEGGLRAGAFALVLLATYLLMWATGNGEVVRPIGLFLGCVALEISLVRRLASTHGGPFDLLD